MVRHSRGFLQRAAIIEIRSYPGRAEAVIAELGLNPSRHSAPADHRIGVRLRQYGPTQLARAPADRAKQRALRIVAQPRAVEIGDQVFVEFVVARHGVALAALLAQPHPQTAVLDIDVLDSHAKRSTDPSERVNHEANQSAV